MPHSVNLSTSTQTKMSRPSSTSTTPKPPSAALLAPGTTAEQNSPSPSHFSFASSPRSLTAPDQPAVEDSRRLRPGTQGSQADRLAASRPVTSRSRQQFYEDSFSYKDGFVSSARDRVTKDAPIIADLRTNVIIKDEYTLVTDLSHHLSTRYQRPETSIMITVNHSACLLLGGSFEPTYVLTISALPIQLQPTTNKRNAALIQTFMCESIGVSADRGIVKFAPIAEESLATNGMTILGEIERLERLQAEESGSVVKRAMTKGSRKSGVFKAKSSIQLSRHSSRANQSARDIPSPIPSDGPLDSGVAVNEKGLAESTPMTATDSKVNHEKSKPVATKSGLKSSAHLAPPPIPEEKSATPRISKRKSLMSVFRR